MIEPEREISMDEVSQIVQDALDNHVQGMQPETIEHSLRGNMSEWYEFSGQDQDGNDMGIEVAHNGGTVLIEQDPQFVDQGSLETEIF